MAKVIEDYNPQKIEIVKRMLDKKPENGIPMAYEIFVDNFKVVMKTTDLSEFDNYEELITDATKYIRINVYNSLTETVGHTKYVFEMKGEKAAENTALSKGLGEVEVHNKIKESIAIERDRWDKEQLNRELDRTKLLLQEAEEYIDDLQTEIEKAKVKTNHWGKMDLGALAGTAIEAMMRKNPQWLNKVPGLESLAGMIEEEGREGVKQIPAEETEVSFKKKSESPTLSEQDQSYLNFGKKVFENFDKTQSTLLLKIIIELSKEPTLLKTVAELLNIPVTAKQ